MAVAIQSESQKEAPRTPTATSIAANFCSTSRRRPTVLARRRLSVPPSSSPASDRAATEMAKAIRTMGASHESSSVFT